jgi:hypothetical protein
MSDEKDSPVVASPAAVSPVPASPAASTIDQLSNNVVDAHKAKSVAQRLLDVARKAHDAAIVAINSAHDDLVKAEEALKAALAKAD